MEEEAVCGRWLVSAEELSDGGCGLRTDHQASKPCRGQCVEGWMLQEPVSRLCSGAACGNLAAAACGGCWEVFSSRPVLKCSLFLYTVHPRVLSREHVVQVSRDGLVQWIEARCSRSGDLNGHVVGRGHVLAGWLSGPAFNFHLVDKPWVDVNGLSELFRALRVPILQMLRVHCWTCVLPAAIWLFGRAGQGMGPAMLLTSFFLASVPRLLAICAEPTVRGGVQHTAVCAWHITPRVGVVHARGYVHVVTRSMQDLSACCEVLGNCMLSSLKLKHCS